MQIMKYTFCFQVAQIETQQKAIHDLKANLMDDLNQRGVLSDPECQRVLQIHQEEQAKLSDKLDSQRQRQEKVRESEGCNVIVIHTLYLPSN